MLSDPTPFYKRFLASGARAIIAIWLERVGVLKRELLVLGGSSEHSKAVGNSISFCVVFTFKIYFS